MEHREYIKHQLKNIVAGLALLLVVTILVTDVMVIDLVVSGVNAGAIVIDGVRGIFNY